MPRIGRIYELNISDECGIIIDENQQEILLKCGHVYEFEEGEQILFDIEITRFGLRAVNIRPWNPDNKAL